MAHVLVFHDDPSIRAFLTDVLEMEGYSVTSVGTMEDALMVLRTSLHPLIAIVERDRSSRHPGGPFFEIVRDQPDLYGQHRYIALYTWHLSDTEKALMQSLNVPLLELPFSVDKLFVLIAAAVASLG